MPVIKRTTKEILRQNLQRTAPPSLAKLKVVLHDVRSMHNVGAVFRNADAFGIDELILSGFSPTPPRAEITKTAIGAEKYVRWRQAGNIQQVLEELKEQGFRLVGLEQTNSSILLPDYTPPARQPLCLIMGNEVTGIDETVLPLINDFVEIPQYGHKHSLNVSVATGITLYAFLQKYWQS